MDFRKKADWAIEVYEENW